MKILNISFVDRFIVTTIMTFFICLVYSIPNFITVGFEATIICLFGLAIISMHLGFTFSCVCEVLKVGINIFKKYIKSNICKEV